LWSAWFGHGGRLFDRLGNRKSTHSTAPITDSEDMYQDSARVTADAFDAQMFAVVHESGVGTNPKSSMSALTSAIGGRAEMFQVGQIRRSLTQSGPWGQITRLASRRPKPPVARNGGTNGVVTLHACTDGEEHSR